MLQVAISGSLPSNCFGDESRQDRHQEGFSLSGSSTGRDNTWRARPNASREHSNLVLVRRELSFLLEWDRLVGTRLRWEEARKDEIDNCLTRRHRKWLQGTAGITQVVEVIERDWPPIGSFLRQVSWE